MRACFYSHAYIDKICKNVTAQIKSIIYAVSEKMKLASTHRNLSILVNLTCF